MTTWLRHVAPAGAPIRLPDLAQWAGLTIPGEDLHAALRAAMCDHFDVRHAYLTATGRAGMTLLFQALRRLASTDRNEIILPAYTCYSLAASAVKAGLRPRLVDVDVHSLDFDFEELERADFGNVLAVVATNLYGLPNNLPRLSELAQDRGVFLIDDAAQAMGAEVGGRKSGTWGDAGLFSFDKGKNVSAIDGGVVVTNSDRVAAALEAETASLTGPGLMESCSGVAKALVYFAMLRPWLYWIPNRIPQLELGKTAFTTEFPLQRPGRPLVALALTMMRRLDEFTQGRTRNAMHLLRGLAHANGIQRIEPQPNSAPVYLRLPLLIDGRVSRDRLIEKLRGIGIGATGSYPASLADVPEVQATLANPGARADGGRYLAAHIVTLPTHPFVTQPDVTRTLAALIAAASSHQGLP